MTYFKEIGMWYLPDNSTTCESAPDLLAWLSAHPVSSGTDTSTGAHLAGPNSLLQRCCQQGGYWENKP